MLSERRRTLRQLALRRRQAEGKARWHHLQALKAFEISRNTDYEPHSRQFATDAASYHERRAASFEAKAAAYRAGMAAIRVRPEPIDRWQFNEKQYRVLQGEIEAIAEKWGYDLAEEDDRDDVETELREVAKERGGLAKYADALIDECGGSPHAWPYGSDLLDACERLAFEEPDFALWAFTLAVREDLGLVPQEWTTDIGLQRPVVRAFWELILDMIATSSGKEAVVQLRDADVDRVLKGRRYKSARIGAKRLLRAKQGTDPN